MTTTTITGTEKQVAWATDIRSEILSDVDAYIAAQMAKAPAGTAQDVLDQAQAQWDAIRAYIANQSDAQYWIAKSGTPAAVMVKYAIQNLRNA